MTIFFFHTDEEQLLPADTAIETVSGLLASQNDVVVLGDLCQLVASGSEELAAISSKDTWIISPYQPRAVSALLSCAGVDSVDAGRIICHRDRSGHDILSQVFGNPPEISDENRSEAEQILDKLRSEEGAWRPWFPVIDRDLCTECKQCAGFCLFGVYEMIEDSVRVANPSRCKDNCPACARVCPSGAIIFPKYPDGPVNGGESSTGEPVRLDPAKLIDKDVMEKLRQRAGNNAGAAAIFRGLQNGGNYDDSKQESQC